jgi:thiol-disulfide isomerase/thioredoxin
MSAQIGSLAPKIKVSEWVQGKPIDTTQEKGNVVVVEVFQVNCPGCFLYGIPQIIDLSKRHREDPLTIFGLATAFEDYDKNTLDNLRLLLSTGEVIVTDSRIRDFIESNVEGYRSYSERDKLDIFERVRQYLNTKKYSAKTFEEFSLRGTPSTIIIDKNGRLRNTVFGASSDLEKVIQNLIQE